METTKDTFNSLAAGGLVLAAVPLVVAAAVLAPVNPPAAVALGVASVACLGAGYNRWTKSPSYPQL